MQRHALSRSDFGTAWSLGEIQWLGLPSGPPLLAASGSPDVFGPMVLKSIPS
jgi:hypothetical protein